MNDTERIQAIQELINNFIVRQPSYEDDETFITVTDHYYLDSKFFPDLFKILDAT